VPHRDVARTRRGSSESSLPAVAEFGAAPPLFTAPDRAPWLDKIVENGVSYRAPAATWAVAADAEQTSKWGLP